MQQPESNGRTAANAESEVSRRRPLKWLIGIAFAAFGIAFALPALGIKSLSQTQQSIAAGDALVYATGDRAGQPVNANDLQPLQAAQAFPQGKETNQDN